MFSGMVIYVSGSFVVSFAVGNDQRQGKVTSYILEVPSLPVFASPRYGHRGDALIDIPTL